MALVEKTQTAEEKKAAGTDQKSREDSFAKQLISTLDLPVGLADAIDEKSGGKGKKVTESQEEEATEGDGSEDSAEEQSSEGDTEDASTEESSTEESEEEGEDEALSPEGKKAAQKRIDDLIKRNKRQEAELNRLRKGQATPPAAEEEVSDPDQKTLNKLASRPDAIEKLNDLRDDVLLAFKKETDPTKEKALLALSKKIDATIAAVPARFQKTQVAHFQSAMRETAEAFGDKLTEEVIDSIASIAKKIYANSSTLQGSLTGQAEAWNLAVERFEEKKTLTAGKSKTDSLQRQNNTLKKKVALDVAVTKGNTDKSEGKRLFTKAKTGNNADKTAFVKSKFNTDSLIPEEYRK